MHRILALLVALAGLSLTSTAPAQAGEVPPTVTFDRAWTVARGAAMEIAWTVTCPDALDQGSGRRHAISTNYGYLEFQCSSRPRRVVLLAPGRAPAKGSTITVQSTVLTPECMYFDSSDLENGENGCWKVTRTDTTRVKSGRFVRESSVDIGSKVEVKRVTRTKKGGLRLTARFSCLGSWNTGYLTLDASQRTRAGYVSSTGLEEVMCEDEAFTRSFTLPRPENGRFRKGKVVIAAEWAQDFEGGPYSSDTEVHRLR